MSRGLARLYWMTEDEFSIRLFTSHKRRREFADNGGCFAMDAPPIAWEHDWDAAFARARRERRVVLVDVEKED